MPHHESGLVALKTTDPKVLDQVVAHFLAQEPDHSIEVVRADQGRGVWLCFGSVISGRTDEHVDLSAFQDDLGLAALAKRVKLPLWVGFAYGGYSNHQYARALSAQGKTLWSSEFDFKWPAALRAEAEDPFTAPDRYQALALEMRGSAGYGKISQEFGVDYFKVLDVEAGDPLFATDKRDVGPDGFAPLADWLDGPWTNPEGNPGDAAEPAQPAQWVAWKLPADEGALARLAGLLTCALEHHRHAVSEANLSVSDEGEDAVVVMSGPAAEALSPLLLTMRFTELGSQLTGTELTSYRGDGGVAAVAAGVGAPGGMFSMSFRGGAGLDRPARGKPLPLVASDELREAVSALRRPQPVAGEEDDGDPVELLLTGMLEALGMTERDTSREKRSTHGKKAASAKKAPQSKKAPPSKKRPSAKKAPTSKKRPGAKKASKSKPKPPARARSRARGKPGR